MAMVCYRLWQWYVTTNSNGMLFVIINSLTIRKMFNIILISISGEMLISLVMSVLEVGAHFY